MIKSTLWYSFLYSLVLVPLGLFLGMLACVAVGIHDNMIGGFSASTLVLLGSMYLSYHLGREKALMKEMKKEAEKKAAETKAAVTMPAAAMPAVIAPAGMTPVETKAAETDPAQTKPLELKLAENKPGDPPVSKP